MKLNLPILILISLALDTSAQKIMKLDEKLKANSEQLSVKMRGGSMLKYDFGVYKTIRAKPGFEKSKTHSRLFSAIEVTESKQKSSIVITGIESDTALINVSINVKSKEVRENIISISKGRVAWEREEDPSKIEQDRNLVAVITTNRDTISWNLIYKAQLTSESSKSNHDAILTDSSRIIEIRTVSTWDNGKSPPFYSVVGFEFYSDSAVIAAVQSPADTFQKKFVWLQKDLDEKTKLILAAAANVLLGFVVQMPP